MFIGQSYLDTHMRKLFAVARQSRMSRSHETHSDEARVGSCEVRQVRRLSGYFLPRSISM